ncbi:MAG TPA: DUF6279 family lipoprotein [Burkholderiales bacterium]|nr:DUF6279 family lipoprotein [Burkholderiales bacterium]
MSVAKVTLALAAAALLAAGCSALRLAYDNAPMYVKYRASQFLDVKGAQDHELAQRIDSFFDWHRAKALPEYARIAEEAALRVGKGLSHDDLVWGYDSLVAHARLGLHAAAQRIAPLLDRLTPEQLAYMEKGFAEENRKFATENLRGSEGDRRKRRAKRVEERLEDWVGTLSQAQVERVRLYSERAPLAGELRDRERKRLQAEVLGMLRARRARDLLPERAANWQAGRDPATAQTYDAARRELYALLLDLDRSLSREQRARAQERLRRYAADFAALARRKDP